MIRAFQWDLARQVERLDWLLDQLPRYADWGYQELYLHLEDAVEYPSLPGVARADAYSYRQFGQLVDAATCYGIRVVPIVNLLGHTQYLIKVPELRDLNELRAPDGSPLERGQLCPLHPRTLEIAEALLHDMAPFCTAGKVHVGLDESFHLGKHPLSSAEVSAIGLAGHFARYVGRLHQLTESLQLRLGLWADMLALLPEAIPLLPRGTIAYDWYYYPFARKPKMELHNFAEYDLAPALRKQGIEYWGCPMNGAFRYEPLPVFGERLDNIRAWWRRCHATGAAGMLITSWEAYRLAIETTTLVDAAASGLWLQPAGEKKTNAELLADGLEKKKRVMPPHRSASSSLPVSRAQNRRSSLETAKALLASDAHAFAGYARWEINERWNGTGGPEELLAHLAEEKFFSRLSALKLPPPLAASVAWRRYLAQRDSFVRRAAAAVQLWRRQLAKKPAARFDVRSQITTAATFHLSLQEGKKAARAMWTQSRDRRVRGQNDVILERDLKRLGQWERWLKQVAKSPRRVWTNSPVFGAWQLTFKVHNVAPAVQKVVVEQQQADGTWTEIGARFTIEFRAYAAHRVAHIRRTFSISIPTPDAPLRIAVRGLGRVKISDAFITNGVETRRTIGRAKIIGRPAPSSGFPILDWTHNKGVLPLHFPPPSTSLRPAARKSSAKNLEGKRAPFTSRVSSKLATSELKQLRWPKERLTTPAKGAGTRRPFPPG